METAIICKGRSSLTANCWLMILIAYRRSYTAVIDRPFQPCLMMAFNVPLGEHQAAAAGAWWMRHGGKAHIP